VGTARIGAAGWWLGLSPRSPGRGIEDSATATPDPTTPRELGGHHTCRWGWLVVIAQGL